MRVRLIAPGKPTPPYPAAAFRHWYGRLLDAGVEILLHPEMAHAKVLRIDEHVLIGGCNLDDLSLFRNDELDLQFADPAVAELTERSDLRRAGRDVDAGDAIERPARPRLERGDGSGLALPLAERPTSARSADGLADGARLRGRIMVGHHDRGSP